MTTYTFTGAWAYEGISDEEVSGTPLIFAGIVFDGSDTMTVSNIEDVEPEEVKRGHAGEAEVAGGGHGYPDRPGPLRSAGRVNTTTRSQAPTRAWLFLSMTDAAIGALRVPRDRRDHARFAAWRLLLFHLVPGGPDPHVHLEGDVEVAGGFHLVAHDLPHLPSSPLSTSKTSSSWTWRIMREA